MTELSKKEKKAIAELKRLALIWPDSLWLFSCSGTLLVMRKENGQRVYDNNGSVDHDYSVTVIHGITNDGGDT